ncbi:MAG: glycoside hydrolase family 127 protein [Anaerolineaceae bacterium]|nr:glycoside hydrolase family 127 protein [Anaerolineaceae bacterium]
MSKRVAYHFTPVPLKNVRITGGFWHRWQEMNRASTIPSVYHFLKETGRIDAIRAGEKERGPVAHIFWDSDVAKWMEGVAYSLAHAPDAELEAQLDDIIDRFAGAQQPDGYLNSHFTVAEPEKRWTNLRDQHELYCAGHLMEAAAAYFEATGKRKFLDVMCRYADYIDSVFGPEDGKKRGYPGHQEIELALVKLWRVTGEERYLKLSKFFIDERGAEPHYYTQEALARGENPDSWHWTTVDNDVQKVDYSYNQSLYPVREQTEATGHAVRAMYMYNAMADLAAEFDDAALKDACDRLFRSVTNRRMYVTGGLGPATWNEGFTDDYDLPNETAYAETCASIGLIFWMQRMARFDCERKYVDVLETALYNGMLSGVSMDGKSFYYSNPLEVNRSNHFLNKVIGNFAGHRLSWYSCSCCPPNVVRLLASLGTYCYAQSENDIAVHLYLESEADFAVDGQQVTLSQVCDYPWDGDVRLSVKTAEAARFGLRLRIPGWCESFTLWVNGEEVPAEMTHGYLRVEREWSDGDEARLRLEMKPRRIYAHPKVRMDNGAVALAYGPVIYCLEGTDNGNDLHALALPVDAEIAAEFDGDLLDGVVSLNGTALRKQAAEDAPLYSSKRPEMARVPFRAVPYALWDNRAEGDMLVWLHETC